MTYILSFPVLFISFFCCMLQSGVIFIQAEEFPWVVLVVQVFWWHMALLLFVWKVLILISKDKILSWEISLKFQCFEGIIHCLLSSIVSSEKATKFYCFSLRIMRFFCPLFGFVYSLSLIFSSILYFSFNDV